MEYYSATKDKIVSFVGKWMELELIISKVSQIQKDKGCMFSLMCG
jgi:hypothetical protein